MLIRLPISIHIGTSMEHRYRKLVRKVKAYLLTERRRESHMGRILRSVGAKLFDEHYWSWDCRSIAIGAGWGGAAAVSPLPFQTLWALLGALWKKGNIPVSILMAWLSPPGFMFIFGPMQWFVGHYLFSLFGFGGSGVTMQMIEEAYALRSFAPLAETHVWLGLCEYLTGAVLTCSLTGILCYFIVKAVWWLFSE